MEEATSESLPTSEISGRLVLLTCLGLAALIGLGGAWYRVSTTDDCVEFWGVEGSQLIVGESEAELLELRPSGGEGGGETLAGFSVTTRHPLSGKPGMVHFRNALTLDRYFAWEKQETVKLPETRERWRQALAFSLGEERLVILLDEGYQHWGRLSDDGETVQVVPAVNLDRMTREYFGVLD